MRPRSCVYKSYTVLIFRTHPAGPLTNIRSISHRVLRATARPQPISNNNKNNNPPPPPPKVRTDTLSSPFYLFVSPPTFFFYILIRSTFNVTLPTSQSPPPSSRIMLRKSQARGGKLKPAGLFIHPNNSNLARADAAAVELGLHRSTERVEAPLRTSCDSDDDDAMAAWGQGRGRDAARNLLRSATTRQQTTRSHSRSESQQKLFQVGDSESDD